MAHHGAGELLLGGVFTTLAQGAHSLEAEAERGSVHGPVLGRPAAGLSAGGRLSESALCGWRITRDYFRVIRHAPRPGAGNAVAHGSQARSWRPGIAGAPGSAPPAGTCRPASAGGAAGGPSRTSPAMGSRRTSSWARPSRWASASSTAQGSSTRCLRKASIAGRRRDRRVEQRVGAAAGRRRSRSGPPSRWYAASAARSRVAGVADLGRDDLADQARHALEHVDRRVVAGVRERRASSTTWPSRIDAHGVGDRLVHVVAVDEHGVEAGDRAGRRWCPRARAAAAAARTPTACSRASRAARRSPGRPRAGPSRSA